MKLSKYLTYLLEFINFPIFLKLLNLIFEFLLINLIFYPNRTIKLEESEKYNKFQIIKILDN